MKEFIKDFLFRGMVACGLGPLALVVIYLILQKNGVVSTLTVNEVTTGILSIAVLAFIAGGLNALYQIERLPLFSAILIHGVVLYLTYLVTYLLNGWFQKGAAPVLIFTGIFIVGYIIIWIMIYFVTRKRAAKLNVILEQRQKSVGEM